MCGRYFLSGSLKNSGDRISFPIRRVTKHPDSKFTSILPSDIDLGKIELPKVPVRTVVDDIFAGTFLPGFEPDAYRLPGMKPLPKKKRKKVEEIIQRLDFPLSARKKVEGMLEDALKVPEVPVLPKKPNFRSVVIGNVGKNPSWFPLADASGMYLMISSTWDVQRVSDLENKDNTRFYDLSEIVTYAINRGALSRVKSGPARRCKDTETIERRRTQKQESHQTRAQRR